MTQLRFETQPHPLNSRCICAFCGRELVEGRDPAVLGTCVPCAEAEAVRRKRLYMRAKRRVDRKGPAEERWPAKETFAGFEDD